MKQSEVAIGSVYQVKVTDKLAPVRIDREHEQGGWVGTNITTRRTVRIKSARRLRECITDPGANTAATTDAGEAAAHREQEPAAPRQVRKRLTKQQRTDLRAAKAEPQHVDQRDDSQPTPRRKKTGCLDAAVLVLEQADEPLTCGQIMQRILEQRLWTTTGRTPAATLYSAVLRQIQRQGDAARFVRAGRGKFALNR